MKELKDCPFCGCRPERERALGESWIWCRCGASGKMCKDDGDAFKMWNTRVQNGEDLQRLAHELNDDNLRLSNLVTKFDTALRTIATEAGMTESYSGVDCDPECAPLVEHVSNLRKALEASNQFILNGGFKS